MLQNINRPLSRVNRFSKDWNGPGKKRKLWLLVAVMFGLILFVIHFSYVSVQDRLWTQSESASHRAIEAGLIKEIKDIEKFSGDKTYIILQGTDDEAQQVIVWLSVEDEEMFAKRVSEGTGKNLAANKTSERVGNAEIIRIVPGVWNGEPVWEVFYKRPEAGAARYYYDYYRFADGYLLETYRLGKR